ncbi:MAG: fructose-bisphosphatase class III [Proteobacteria bacterium]|nr:fructose-bisphosphatase class III [Pseudomonadota bacterium]
MNLLSHADPSLDHRKDKLAQEILRIDSRLDSHIPSTLWISDLHGEGERFKSILRGRFGLLYQTCKEALPFNMSDQRIRHLVQIIRNQSYTGSDQKEFSIPEIIDLLTQIIKFKMDHVEYETEKVILPEFRRYILKLVAGEKVPDTLFNDKTIAYRFIFHLCHTVKQVLLDRILVLGDIWDRGPEPDQIIRILSSGQIAPFVDLVLGNHEVLWMGAACGNRPLIAEAIRITCRYDLFDLLNRLGFDVSILKNFATKTYPLEKCTARIKATTDAGKAMEKALSVIQFKLEDELIAAHPEFEMEGRRSIGHLANILKAGSIEQLNDAFFPTIDLENPAKLTDEEAEVIDDLEKQFRENKVLKRLLAFFFTQGKTYHVHDKLLNIHALVPSTAGGEFELFLGKKGKALLDFIQESIEGAGQAYLKGEPQDETKQALFFYLWCGPKSPFFGKQAMKTFERYYLIDKSTHTEPSLYWKSNLLTDAFKQKILAEFDAHRVIYGHTPIDVTKGKKMASKDGIAINIDGGFAAAYYNRGHALVQTAYQLYGIILPTSEGLESSPAQSISNPLAIELIADFDPPLTVRDTTDGKKLLARQKELLQEMRSLSERKKQVPSSI